MRPAETHAAITSPLGSAEQLFYAALEVPEAERAARLHTWCDGDRALEERVLALVRSDASVAERIKSVPVMHDAGAGVLDTTGAEAWQNRQLGKYRLTGLLGSGGMGDVYLAERLDSPGSQAAIKCIQQRLRDSPAVKHFLLERDSLAGLAHPNIARLLDGGVQEAGAPYLVMEYVAGERLDAVADRESTSIRDIVGLVAQLLDAVGYAHRHLIVHRDIKPGNVMVSEQGVVKLLDFGALKLLGNGEAQSQMTVAGMRPLTLRYSSPEHLRGAPVTTAADLYSLGVLLYRLVAGRKLPVNFPKRRSTLGWRRTWMQSSRKPCGSNPRTATQARQQCGPTWSGLWRTGRSKRVERTVDMSLDAGSGAIAWESPLELRRGVYWPWDCLQ
jgi:serine/threonine protein kinase